MIKLWLRRKGYETPRADCTIERSDSIDLESLAREECRVWYERLLREAPPEMLILHDLEAEGKLVMAQTLVPSLMAILPAECVRPVAVKMTDWLAPATIVDADSPLGRRQSSSYAAGGIVAPVAIVRPGNRVELFGSNYQEYEKPEYFYCVCHPEPDSDGSPVYEFRASALTTL